MFSIAVYREIITHSGFPNNYTMKPCRFSDLQESCSICEWMFKNKLMLVFGACLLVTAVMLAALVVFVFTTKRNEILGRARQKGRVKRRRQKERAPLCLCPPTARY